MLTNQKQFLYRLYFVSCIFIVLGFSIGYKVLNIQFYNGEKYRAIAKEKAIKNFVVVPKRGNIYSDDGSLLATSLANYDIYYDAVTVSEKNFNRNINELSNLLAKKFNKTQTFFKNYLIEAKNKKRRYLPIAKNVSLSSLNEIKRMPLFRLGGIKGGLIVEKKIVREYPLNKIAERTIGYERQNEKKDYVGVGLEHAFGNILRGRNGSQYMQKISNGNWKPIPNSNQIEPKPGEDIKTTINIGFQDIAHHSLLSQLEKFEAEHGSIVIMETGTGAIKAISNLGRTSEGKYYEKLNYAVGESHEPGSTFKLMSMVAALEDGVVDATKIIDTKNGELVFYGNKVRDSKKGGYGKITASEVFKFSSNTGIVDIIMNGYSKNPEKFSDRLYNMGLNKTLNLSIKGEGKPKIPHPKDKSWNGLSLPWMAYGYGVSLTPIQTLSFYNAIANGGELLKPVFVQKGKTSKKVVLNPSICSKKTIAQIKLMLKSVVNEKGGTAYNIKSNDFEIAGKTGTCQVDYNTENTQYISSFVGYFPADKPIYSCIVVIHKPNKNIGYFGNIVAAPVFKKIAQKIYSITPQIKSTINKNNLLTEMSDYKTNEKEDVEFKIENIIGKNFYEILPKLENKGYEVKNKGKGLIIKNFKIVKKLNSKKIFIELA